MKTLISSKDRESKARLVFEKDSASYIYQKQREQREQESRRKSEENREKLKAYITHVRSKYAENPALLAYLESNVISKWICMDYHRSANLAHFDVEKALENYNSK